MRDRHAAGRPHLADPARRHLPPPRRRRDRHRPAAHRVRARLAHRARPLGRRRGRVRDRAGPDAHLGPPEHRRTGRRADDDDRGDGGMTLLPASLPLSAAQHAVWTAQQLDPDVSMFTCGVTFDLTGPVDAGLLDAAVRQAVAETDALRVRFVGDPVRQVVDDTVTGSLLVVDTTAPDEWIEARQAEVLRLDGELFLHALVRISPQRHRFYLRYHHILLDGYGQ